MNDKEVIERLNRFKTIKVMYGNTFAMHLEQLKQLQQDLETILNVLENQKVEIEDAKEYADDVWRHNQELKEKLEGKECVIENQKAELDNLKTIEEENKFLRNQELGYIAGYEDGKKHKMTAVAMRIENMKYELYERHIKVLKKRIEDLLSIEEAHRKENGKLRAEIEKKDKALRECERNLIEERQNRIKEDKIINLMAEDIYGYQIECNRYFKDKEEVIKYFEKKVKESK